MYIVMLMNSSDDDEYCMYGNHMTGFTTILGTTSNRHGNMYNNILPHICIRLYMWPELQV